MPGMYGFTKLPGRNCDVESMGRMLCHSARQAPGTRLEDHLMAAGSVAVNEHYARKTPAEVHGCFVWLDGEVLNAHELGRTADERSNAAVLIARMLDQDVYLDLPRLNGYFAAVGYDSRRRTIVLLSDRFGLRHVFYRLARGQFAWCSEQKGFLAIPGFDASLAGPSVRSFLKWRHLHGDVTWFNDVHLVKPASVTKFGIDTQQLTSVRYWDWRAIDPGEGQPSDAEIVTRMCQILQPAVHRSHPRVGI